MNGLQTGHLRRAVLAATALVAGVALVVPTAHAGTHSNDTIGGPALASAQRTVSLQDGATELPPIKAASWVLADAETGEILAHKGAHLRRAPASTLKMLTALTVMPRTSPDTTYVATSRAATIYGARVGLRPGKKYTMDDLWYAVFLPSANDAAIAVAEANGGVKKTVRQMNKVAYDLRALDTVAKNTNGLDAPGQLTSAYDLALFAREGLTREDFARYAGTARAQFPNMKGKGTHTIYTTNRMLLHGWRGAIGVKTGFTTKAGRTFAGAARRQGRTLIVTLMGIQEPTESAAKKLLAWGFDNADRVEPVGQLVERGSPLPEPAPAASPGADSVGDGPSGDGGMTEAGAGEPSGGVATTAAGAGDDIQGMPALAVLAALLVAGGAIVLVVVLRSPKGRHSSPA